MISEAPLNTPLGPITAGLRTLRGLPGHGVYRLTMELSLVPPRPARFGGVKLLATGRLAAGAEGLATRPLASAFLELPVEFPSEDRNRQLMTSARFYADVAPEQIDELERVRGKGGVQLQLAMQGYLASTDAFMSFWGQVSYRVASKDWITVLEDVHYARGVLIQIPEYPRRFSPRAEDAINYVEKASQAIIYGNYREAVGLCRDALERAYPDSPIEYKDKKPRFVDSREADKELRFWWLQQAVLTITHAAKHADEIAGQIEWNRDDAITAVTVVAALLRRAPPS